MMTPRDLLEILEDHEDNDAFMDHPIILAWQPNYPLQAEVEKAELVVMPGILPVLVVAASDRVEYLDGHIANEIGWADGFRRGG